jgi:hypothetical protein
LLACHEVVLVAEHALNDNCSKQRPLHSLFRYVTCLEEVVVGLFRLIFVQFSFALAAETSPNILLHLLISALMKELRIDLFGEEKMDTVSNRSLPSE